MADMPVDERSERIVDVVEDSEALLPEDVEVLRSELRRLREIEAAARELVDNAGPEVTPKGFGERNYVKVGPGRLRRLRTALDADRGGQGE